MVKVDRGTAKQQFKKNLYINICFRKHVEENLINLVHSKWICVKELPHAYDFIFVCHIIAAVCCEQNIKNRLSKRLSLKPWTENGRTENEERGMLWRNALGCASGNVSENASGNLQETSRGISSGFYNNLFYCKLNVECCGC